MVHLWNIFLFIYVLLKHFTFNWNKRETSLLNWYNRRLNGHILKPQKENMSADGSFVKHLPTCAYIIEPLPFKL
jgi:hypothetical protein